MTIATTNRDTKFMLEPLRSWPAEFTVLDTVELFAGCMLAIDSTPEAQMAADTAGLVVVGRCPVGLDNADDGLVTNADLGIFLYANDGGNPVVDQVDDVCYVKDNQTVCAAAGSTNKIVAGLVVAVTSAGVWVDQTLKGLREAKVLAAWRGQLAAAPADLAEGQFFYDLTAHAMKYKDNVGIKVFQNIILWFLVCALACLLGFANSATAADRTPMVQTDAAKGTSASAVLADNVKVPGTLEVVGATTLTGNVTMSGSVTAAGFIGRVSRTMAIADFTDNTNATGYCDITAQIPAGALVLGWKAVTTAGFAGDTTAVISVGKAGALTDFSTTTNGSVLTPGTVGSASVLATSFCAAATTVRCTITGGADFTSIVTNAAGSVTVTVFYAY